MVYSQDKEGASRMKISTLGIDISKNYFQLHGVDIVGQRILKKKLTRKQFIEFLPQLLQCRIVIEAGSAAHYWGRKLQSLGHEVKLIAPQFVKPFVKSNKNDANDAEAIVEASLRPSMRFVQVKSEWQVELQSLHRNRSRIVGCRVQLTNAIHGFLQEYGILIPKAMTKFKEQIAWLISPECADIPNLFKSELTNMYEELLSYLEREKELNKKLKTIGDEHDVCKRLQTIPGIGPTIATALYAGVADPQSFKNGREFAAWLGLVPKQNSTGGKDRLLGISKRGDKNLRCLIIHGARASYCRIKQKPAENNLGKWVLEKSESRGSNKAIVALANKMARYAWVVMAKNEEFRYAV